jgi:hypothetical protein
MPECDLQHGAVRPCPILAAPASPGNTLATSSPSWPTRGPPSTRPRWAAAAAMRAAVPPEPAPPPAGLVRPRAGDPGRAATPAPAPGPGNAVGGGPRNRHPRRRRGPPAAGRPRVCRPRPAGGAAADAGRRVRLRPGQRGGAAPGRHRDPGPPAPRLPSGPAGVRLRQAQAKHQQAHRLQRRARPHPVGRGGAARPHARPDRRQDRGHRRPVGTASHGQGPGRRGSRPASWPTRTCWSSKSH